MLTQKEINEYDWEYIKSVLGADGAEQYRKSLENQVVVFQNDGTIHLPHPNKEGTGKCFGRIVRLFYPWIGWTPTKHYLCMDCGRIGTQETVEMEDCLMCGGHGALTEHIQCAVCKGKGKLQKDHPVNVRIREEREPKEPCQGCLADAALYDGDIPIKHTCR